MKVIYFSDTDTALIELSTNAAVETQEINENISIDLDEMGNTVSITIEHVKANSKQWEFSYQETHIA